MDESIFVLYPSPIPHHFAPKNEKWCVFSKEKCRKACIETYFFVYLQPSKLRLASFTKAKLTSAFLCGKVLTDSTMVEKPQ